MGKLSMYVLLCLSASQMAFGQKDLQLMKLNSKDIGEVPIVTSFAEESIEPEYGFLTYRFNWMGYKPIKSDGFQVISAHQHNTNFDIVYFIDKSGHTTKRIMATTAPQNFDRTTRAHYDSMNPYGSNDMTSVLINVLLGSVINRGLGLL